MDPAVVGSAQFGLLFKTHLPGNYQGYPEADLLADSCLYPERWYPVSLRCHNPEQCLQDQREDGSNRRITKPSSTFPPI